MLKGIDVSYCQSMKYNNIDKSQVQFAIIRSSFGWEDNQKDSEFENHYKGFKNLGIPVGAYHYSYATNADEGRKEADYCYQCIKGKSFELPIYFDIEDNSVIKYGKRNLTDAVIAFCEQMKKYGYRVGVYTNPSWLNNYLYKEELLGKYNIWLAHWGASSPAYTCGVWQYGVGSKGSVSGISGEIDLDYLMDNNLISKSTTTNTTNTSTTKTTNSGNVDVTYKVHTCKRWQPSVKNTEDYAGVENCTIKGVYMKPSKGHLRYRVRLLNGNWLPWVQDYEDFAGANSLSVDIDCIQIELVGLSGYTVEYRVSTTKSTGYLPWVREYNNNNDDGYAGIKGIAIDKLQIRIVKK